MSNPRRPSTRPSTRNDENIRPRTTRSALSAGFDRRPYPGAPTRTKPSPAGPRRRTRQPVTASTPTPASVWPSGPYPSDPDTPWPRPITTKIVTSFTRPGEHVLVLPWPAHPQTQIPAPAEAPDDIAAVVAIITSLKRRAAAVQPDNAPTPATPATAQTPPASSSEPGHPSGDSRPGQADLVLTTVHPRDCRTHLAERVALLAARLLRAGGLLVVLTHCDWSDGTLLDPTGTIVTAGQNADLLYLQHIVALHTPIPDGGTAALAGDGQVHPPCGRTAPTDTTRGHRQPHQRIHSDVLVFTQPHDHQLHSDPPTTEQPIEEGTR